MDEVNRGSLFQLLTSEEGGRGVTPNTVALLLAHFPQYHHISF